MKNTAKTEFEMRNSTAPSPDSIYELTEFIVSLRDMQHNYGTCVYAMSLASVATFNYMVRKLGVTGFQASCADMDILKRTRGLKGGFIFLKTEDMLYPQYDLPAKLAEWMSRVETHLWLRDEAKKLIEEMEKTNRPVHPDVIAHWRKLAAYKEPKTPQSPDV